MTRGAFRATGAHGTLLLAAVVLLVLSGVFEVSARGAWPYLIRLLER